MSNMGLAKKVIRMSEQCANNSVRKWQTEGSELYVISDSTCYSYHGTVSTDYVEFNTNRASSMVYSVRTEIF
jgi:hypothetical protein